LFLKLLGPVITKAIADYEAFSYIHKGKTYFNAVKGLFKQDTTDEAENM
jgi:hypothetical protein